MQDLQFIESIKIVDGRFVRPQFHLERMKRTQLEVFGHSATFDFNPALIPPEHRQGVVKCRVIYDREIRHFSFSFYHPRPVCSLKLTDGKDVDYHLKYADRRHLEQLRQERGECDDVLIVCNNRITDTSYSNVVLYDGTDYFTPRTYLLNGTQRRYLLQRGIIKETDIRPQDLSSFKCLYLINAMLGLEDNITIPVGHIIF